MNSVASSISPGTLALPDNVLHGEPLRPPVMAWDGQHYCGARLRTLETSEGLPGVVKVVQQQNFIGVIAVSAVQARQAVDSLRAEWQTSPPLHSSLHTGSANLPPDVSTPVYSWALPAHKEPAGAYATVWCAGAYATAWVPSPASDRACEILIEELGRVLQLESHRVTLVDIGHDPSGSIHELDVLDAVADAALLSQAVQRPVRVPIGGLQATEVLSLWPQLSGHDAAYTSQLPEASGTATEEYAAEVSTKVSWRSVSPWAVRPSLARLLSQPSQATPSDWPRVVSSTEGGMLSPDTVSQPQPLVHAVAVELEAAQVFAQEVWVDEQAIHRGLAPLAYRLRHTPEGPGRRLLEHMAARIGGPGFSRERDQKNTTLHEPMIVDGLLHGRGYASARTQVLGPGGQTVESWSAWVVEVAVDASTGHIDLARVVVGRDGGMLREAQTTDIRNGEPQLLDAARRLLATPVRFDDWGGISAGDSASTVAASGSTMIALEGQESGALTNGHGSAAVHGVLEAGGVVTLPAAAAISNAIFDATGVRLRHVPFEAETLRRALAPAQSATSLASMTRRWLKRGWLAAGSALMASAGLIAMAWPVKPAFAPTDGPDVSLYSAAAIERGRQVAAAGDCVVCHTAPNGQTNAGGFALDTAFGVIYSTNITPDKETGIGRWSYKAFERAMREGVHRDGYPLYPAFPYTAFAKMTDADMQALYAYLMTQAPVNNKAPETRLPFPYNIRASLAGWNLLFHENRVFQPDPAQSLEWNRGAYLVESIGHCGACHTPRNALGAEKSGQGHYLAGGESEGWVAPALDHLSRARIPWSPDELYQYLRTGFSARHGVAAGPMAPVIRGLAELPASDVRAISTYLLSLPGNLPSRNDPLEQAQRTLAQEADATLLQTHVNGERIYQNACAVCHESGQGPTLFGVKPFLKTNTSLHADTPDNLIQVVLHGIPAPANDDLGYMPGFGDSLDDVQIADLVGYLRQRFAPEEKAWAIDGTMIKRWRMQAHAPHQ